MSSHRRGARTLCPELGSPVLLKVLAKLWCSGPLARPHSGDYRILADNASAVPHLRLAQMHLDPCIRLHPLKWQRHVRADNVQIVESWIDSRAPCCPTSTTWDASPCSPLSLVNEVSDAAIISPMVLRWHCVELAHERQHWRGVCDIRQTVQHGCPGNEIECADAVDRYDHRATVKACQRLNRVCHTFATRFRRQSVLKR